MHPSKNASQLLEAIAKANVMAAECPSRQVLQHLTSRWGTLVMIALATGPHRFSELRRRIGGVSERMLAQTLQLLEADGMVLRVAHNVVPPHVVYSLTPMGEKAADQIVGLSSWIEDNLPRILANRSPEQIAV